MITIVLFTRGDRRRDHKLDHFPAVNTRGDSRGERLGEIVVIRSILVINVKSTVLIFYSCK